MSLTSKPAAEVAAERKAALEQHAQILAALAEFGLSTSDPVGTIAGLVRERDDANAKLSESAEWSAMTSTYAREHDLAVAYYDALERCGYDAAETAAARIELDEIAGKMSANQAFVAYVERKREIWDRRSEQIKEALARACAAETQLADALARIEGKRPNEASSLHGGNPADPLPPGEDTRRESWESFRAAGMLWMANRVLHVFGWAVVVEIDDATDKILGAHPRRATWRGFSAESEERGFRSVSRFMRDAGATLADEADS